MIEIGGKWKKKFLNLETKWWICGVKKMEGNDYEVF
jgi:hypothetical protein